MGSIFALDPNLITPAMLDTEEVRKRTVLTQKIMDVHKKDYALLNLVMSPLVKKQTFTSWNDIEIMTCVPKTGKATVAAYDAETYTITVAGLTVQDSLLPFDKIAYTIEADGTTVSASAGKPQMIKSISTSGSNTVIVLFAPFASNPAAGATIEQVSQANPIGGIARPALSPETVIYKQNIGLYRNSVSKIQGVKDTDQYISLWLEGQRNIIARIKHDQQYGMLIGTKSFTDKDPANNQTVISNCTGILTGLMAGTFPATLIDPIPQVSASGQSFNFNNTITMDKVAEFLSAYKYSDSPTALCTSDFMDALFLMQWEKSQIKFEENPFYRIASIQIGDVKMQFVEYFDLNRPGRYPYGIGGVVLDKNDLLLMRHIDNEGYLPKDVLLANNMLQDSKEMRTSSALALYNAHKHGYFYFDKTADLSAL